MHRLLLACTIARAETILANWQFQIKINYFLAHNRFSRLSACIEALDMQKFNFANFIFNESKKTK